MVLRSTLPVIALMVTVLCGCSSTGGRAPDAGASMLSARPSLSMSATRTVPEQTIQAEPPILENYSQPSASTETGVTFYRLKVGDPIVIHLRGIYPKDEAVEDIIDEDGNVTVPLIGDILAVGKSTSQLESDIRRMYIDGGYYREITVNAVMPSPSYFIRGEIRLPGRYPIVSGVTIMQAIAAGGGYTEFASPRSVKLIRGGKTNTLNMRDIERNPERDVRLESGDVIVVDRAIL